MGVAMKRRVVVPGRRGLGPVRRQFFEATARNPASGGSAVKGLLLRGQSMPLDESLGDA